MKAPMTQKEYRPLIVPRICDLFRSVYANSLSSKTRTPLYAVRESWVRILGHERLLSMDYAIKTELDRYWPFEGCVRDGYETERYPDETPKRSLKFQPSRRRKINFSNAEPKVLFGKVTAQAKEPTEQSLTHHQAKRKRQFDQQTHDQPSKRSRNDHESQKEDTLAMKPCKLIKMTFSPSPMQTSLDNNKQRLSRKPLHHDITNDAGLDKVDEDFLRTHGFLFAEE